MKPACLARRYGRLLPFVLLLFPLAAGCGRSQSKSTVSGKVTFQGNALSSGFVTFAPEEGAPLHSDIQRDGSYRLNNVPVGPVKIAIAPKSEHEMPKTMPRNPKDYGKAKAAITQSKTTIPPKYNDPNQSGLTYTVKQGSQQHDIDLK